VKTDRRDATKLARSYRAGDLTPVWVPDEAHEALRDLVRARAAAKQDQLRARHRLSKFLLRHGRGPTSGVKPWTLNYMDWVRQQVQFEPPAQDYTRLDYLHEVEHANDRVRRLEEAIGEAVKLAPSQMREVIQALPALRISAVTIVSELSQISRFAGARQLMGYSGAVASEDSSGKRYNWCGLSDWRSLPHAQRSQMADGCSHSSFSVHLEIRIPRTDCVDDEDAGRHARDRDSAARP
jgi:transposase